MGGAEGDGAAPAAIADALLDAAYPPPARRDLRVFAHDPMVARLLGVSANVVTLSVPWEQLRPGPRGTLIEIVDYDATARVFYAPVHLDHPNVLAQDGLDPSEDDPRFHQQMVYAVVRSFLENWERGMGRVFGWSGNHPLRIYPHAFRAANAYFDPNGGGRLLFGYFRADAAAPGRNLPDQHVYSCLSHDIIVHETTHALVHKNRKYLKEPTNPDVFAFHEGFADLMAIFQHFTVPDLVAHHLRQGRGDLTSSTALVALAQQFGEGVGRGQALRDALGAPPDPALATATLAPHARGALLVAAVFDGFAGAYQRATQDLVRLATGGSGVLPAGAIHPDLTTRLASEATSLAHRALLMCVRAFEYLPPVDVDFSDFLRSLVTADRDLFPGDPGDLRTLTVEGFRQRGLVSDRLGSLHDNAVVWPAYDGDLRLDDAIVQPLVMKAASRYATPRQADQRAPLPDSVAMAVRRWAKAHWRDLGADHALRFDPDGFHALFRVGANGRPHIDIVLRVVQTIPPETAGTTEGRLGGLRLRGGTTIVADALGQVRYLISKPIPHAGGTDRQRQRLAEMEAFAASVSAMNGLTPWLDRASSVGEVLNFAAVDDPRFDW